MHICTCVYIHIHFCNPDLGPMLNMYNDMQLGLLWGPRIIQAHIDLQCIIGHGSPAQWYLRLGRLFCHTYIVLAARSLERCEPLSPGNNCATKRFAIFFCASSTL